MSNLPNVERNELSDLVITNVPFLLDTNQKEVMMRKNVEH